MIYRDVEFKIDQSELEPRTLAVFRKVSGDSLREFVTGITPATKFQYRLPSTGIYQNSITGAPIDSIENIRVIASAIATDSIGGIQSYSYEWTLGIPLTEQELSPRDAGHSGLEVADDPRGGFVLALSGPSPFWHWGGWRCGLPDRVQ